MDSCCTCATLLTDTKIPYDPESEKPLCFDRKLQCCGRTICAQCQYRNSRFQTYCPFCQLSTAPNAIPSTGLRLPPSYSEDGTVGLTSSEDRPPNYESITMPRSSRTGPSPPTDTQDVVHFVSNNDTIHSLSLAYSTPASILKQHNNLFQDALLQARKFVLIPYSHYQGPALSTPPDLAEEERKNNIRRWMVSTKCPDYSVALLYLKGCDYDLRAAIDNFRGDEQWEKGHPLDKGKDKARDRKTRQRKITGSSLAGQLM